MKNIRMKLFTRETQNIYFRCRNFRAIRGFADFSAWDAKKSQACDPQKLIHAKKSQARDQIKNKTQETEDQRKREKNWFYLLR